MYIFKAKYQNMDTGAEVTRKIEFDGDNFCIDERECYEYAMKAAYDTKDKNEFLYSLELVSC